MAPPGCNLRRFQEVQSKSSMTLRAKVRCHCVRSPQTWTDGLPPQSLLWSNRPLRLVWFKLSIPAIRGVLNLKSPPTLVYDVSLMRTVVSPIHLRTALPKDVSQPPITIQIPPCIPRPLATTPTGPAKPKNPQPSSHSSKDNYKSSGSKTWL